MAYEYIPNEFGRNWVTSEDAARRGVYTPLCYIDINEGNRYDADLFAQIMYWHTPTKGENPRPRLRRKDNGVYWLIKNHGDWYAETRICKSTAKRCMERLCERNLIIYEVHGHEGNKTPWIRVNWDEFERRMKLWMAWQEMLPKDDEEKPIVTEADEAQWKRMLAGTAAKNFVELLHAFVNNPDTKYPPPDTTYPPTDMRDTGGVYEISGVRDAVYDPQIPKLQSNTETTTETPKTVEIKEIPLSPMGESATSAFDTFVEEELVIDDEPKLTDEQIAVIYAYDLERPKKGDPPGVWSYLNQLVNFFTGRVKKKPGKQRQTLYYDYQLHEMPLTAVQIMAFKIWYSSTYPELTFPQKPETINKFAGEFMLSKKRPIAEKRAAERLAQIKAAQQPPTPEPEPEYDEAAAEAFWAKWDESIKDWTASR